MWCCLHGLLKIFLCPPFHCVAAVPMQGSCACVTGHRLGFQAAVAVGCQELFVFLGMLAERRWVTVERHWDTSCACMVFMHFQGFAWCMVALPVVLVSPGAKLQAAQTLCHRAGGLQREP